MPRVKSLSSNSQGGPHFKILRANGFEVEMALPDVDLSQEDKVISALRGCQASVAGSEPYSRRVIESLPDLRVIARSGVGFDAVDVARRAMMPESSSQPLQVCTIMRSPSTRSDC